MFFRVLLAIALALPLTAQGLFEEFTAERLMRHNIKSKKKELLELGMHFSDDEQARTFWKIHRAYEAEIAALNDRAFALLSRYNGSQGSVQPSEAVSLSREGLRLDRSRIAIREKYLDRIAKAVSPVVASRFVQLESLFHSVLAVQLAMNVALPE